MREKTFPTSVRLTEKEKLLLRSLIEHFRKTNVGDVSKNDVMRLALKRLAEAEGVKMTTLVNASRDAIISKIHVLWERGWKVSPIAVKEMLQISHEDSSIERIEAVMHDVIAPGSREEWLKGFNHDSPFANAMGFPWEIGSHLQHQQIDEDATI